jgi:hypothetical protein
LCLCNRFHFVFLQLCFNSSSATFFGTHSSSRYIYNILHLDCVHKHPSSTFVESQDQSRRQQPFYSRSCWPIQKFQSTGRREDDRATRTGRTKGGRQ